MSDVERQEKIAMRLPASMVQEMREIAEREDRSLSAEIRRAIRRHITAVRSDGGR